MESHGRGGVSALFGREKSSPVGLVLTESRSGETCWSHDSVGDDAKLHGARPMVASARRDL